MIKIILAEKPSQAREIARAFKSYKQKEGYIECESGWVITWAFGHLFEIDTEKIFPRGRILEFPEKFEYKLKDGVGKQFKVIKSLLSKADEVFVFTDPEREGELLARIILRQAGWQKWDKTYRFWSSKALTPDVVWEEIKARKPIKDFDNIFYEALARQHSDWLVGIPLSRVLMEKFGGVWSVGRVQTPTLHLLCKREEEIRNFKPVEYYVVKVLFGKNEEIFEAHFVKDKAVLEEENKTKSEIENEEDEEREDKEETRYGLDKATAEKVASEVRKIGKGVVVEVKKRIKKEHPPLLYSLTVLQKEAGQRYGFSAEKTLSIAQRLYEKALISYPRTESQHLAEKDRALVKEVLKKLGRSDLIDAVDKVGKRVFDDAKLTDHFALIPMRAPSKDDVLGEEEKKIYDMVVKKFLAVFYPDFIWEETTVLIKVGSYSFVSKGKVIKQRGWTELLGGGKDVFLPDLKKGNEVKVNSAKFERKETKAPRRFSDGVLVAKMKKIGIGTPATRAGIIEALLKRGYVERGRKELIPSGKGIELVKKLAEKGCKLVSVELTAEWEKRLKEIREKKLGLKGYREFIEGIKNFVRENVELLRKLDLNKEVVTCKYSFNKEKVDKRAYKRGKKGGRRNERGSFKGKDSKKRF
jgi:DNA topoisomerase-3